MSFATVARETGNRVRVFFAIVLIFSLSTALAGSAEDATFYLLSQQHADGAIAGAADIATPEQATAEALITLAATGPVRDAGLAFLGSMPLAHQPTRYLARLIVASDGGSAASRANLLSRQNMDGGFGVMPGALSNVRDTAYALEALASTDLANGSEAQRAVAYLLNARSGNVWNGNTSAIDAALSLRAWHALFPYRHAFSGVSGVLDAALAELSALTPDEDFLDAQLLLAEMRRSQDESDYLARLQSLESRQQADGSWSSDVYSTALALRALRAQEEGANPDLGSIRGALRDGELDTPLSGISVALSGPERHVVVTDAAGQFRFGGLPTGSYTVTVAAVSYTALTAEIDAAVGEHVELGVLRLFALADPSQAVLTGRVTTVAGDVLAGAQIAVAGAATVNTVSGIDGAYHVGGLVPGVYTVTISHAGYVPQQSNVALAAGTVAFVEARLAAEPVQEFFLSGQILHGETDAPLANVTVQVSGGATATFVTDAAGSYAGTVPGTGVVQLTAALDGFEPVTLNRVTVGGESVDFSPALFPIGSDDPRARRGGLRGRVIDEFSGLPIAGAALQLTGATNSALTGSDGNGLFQFDLQAAENSVLETSADGYQSDARMAVPVAGITLDIGDIALLPNEGEYPVDIGGTVVDSVTGLPLAGVSLNVEQDGAAWQIVTDQDGRFTFEVNRIFPVSITFEHQDYDSETLVVLPHLAGDDLGNIRLRPGAADAPLPDLVIGNVAAAGGFTDPFSFDASGTVGVSIFNRGSQAVTTAFDVVAFIDVDGDGLFTAGIDAEHGRLTVLNGIAVDGEESVTLLLHGVLPFRDAPLAIAVDPANHVIEQSDGNNVSSTAAACRAVPDVGAFNPVEKYQALRGRKVVSTPLVANFTDDNGDGAIDAGDVPDIIVPGYDGFGQFDGAGIFILDGATGAQHYRTEGARNVAALNDAAIADIDGDGLPEIVAAHSDGNHLIAFEHDGTQKWLSDFDPLPGRRDGAGAIVIADLDGDAVPEIVAGASVYSNTGQLLGDGRDLGGTTGFKLYVSLSAVADVDLDGVPEILAGPTAYEFRNGVLSIDWRRADLADGFVGVANFDGDDFAEIVLVGPGEVRVLNHDGSDLTSWAPASGGVVAFPGGGQAGPPTIADVDGDGEIEIGVAGASFYAVFNADGSILWQSPIRDLSSQVTGSTSFDFEGDGIAEIIYRDELALRIYRGPDGAVLYSRPLRSGTATELPVVADVDADGHAEIVVVADHHFGGGLNDTGVHVFEDAQDSWLDTRRIWNQHSYHITNINDDASIPVDEQPSWLTHNTYRLNTFPDRDPLQAPDLTVGRLEIVDNGIGQPLSLRARIGNAGLAPSASGIIVSFHDGDSAALLLGSVSLPALAPGEWQDIELTDITSVSAVAGITAVIEIEAGLDCAIANNSITQSGLPTVGSIGITTNAPEYAPESDVLFTAVVENAGSFTRTFAAQLRVEDAAGNVVVEFPVQNLGELAAGEQRIVQENWNTALFLAGEYRLRGHLFDAAGALLAESTANFRLAHDAQSGALAELRLATDRARYHTRDQVRFDLLAQNVSISTLLAASTLHLTVTSPGGAVVHDRTLAVRELSPDNAATVLDTQVLNAAAIGDYHVTAVWRAADDTVLASAERDYEVFENLALALQGSVTVATPQLFVGEAQLCTESALNTGTLPASVQLRHTVARLDQPGATVGEPFAVTLEPDAEQTWLRGVDTVGMSAGDYACILEAKIDGAWQPLGNAFFRLVPLPIRIDAALNAGAHGRLLVLLDPACADRDDDVDDRRDGRDGDDHDREDGDDDDHDRSDGGCDADPYGPDAAPPLPIQRAHLEAVLTGAGWNHTIVTDAGDFATEFANGGYELYALFSEQLKLPEHVQRAVVDDIEAGRGLLVAGNHDRRNGRLEEALGIKSLGKNLDVEALVVQPFSEHPGGEWQFLIAHRPQAVRLRGADVIAEYRLDERDDCRQHDKHGDGDDCDRDDKQASAGSGNHSQDRDQDSGRGDCRDWDDKYGRGGDRDCDDDDASNAAVTRHDHGGGVGVYAGFDWLVQSATEGDDGEFAGLLTAAFDVAHPQPYTAIAGRVFPLRLVLVNEGVATPGEVRLALPTGTELVEGPSGASVIDGVVRWPFTLAEAQQLTFDVWLRLPDVAGSLALEAVIFSGAGDELTEQARASLTVDVQQE